MKEESKARLSKAMMDKIGQIKRNTCIHACYYAETEDECVMFNRPGGPT